MAKGKSKISFKVNLSDLVDTEKLNKLSQSTKKEISKEISEFIIDRILEDTSNRRSSVTGQLWKGLSPDYKAKKEKIAPGVANLELHGDMLDALKSRNSHEGSEIGIFIRKQAEKADGHTHAKEFGISKLPTRKFMPTKNEKLRSGILKDVVKIAKELVDSAPEKYSRGGDYDEG